MVTIFVVPRGTAYTSASWSCVVLPKRPTARDAAAMNPLPSGKFSTSPFARPFVGTPSCRLTGSTA
jgi:hypothetical protein